jgi:hypothetical protein
MIVDGFYSSHPYIRLRLEDLMVFLAALEGCAYFKLGRFSGDDLYKYASST